MANNDINVKIGGDTNGLKKKVSGMKKMFKNIGTWASAGIAVGIAAVVMLTKKLVELGDGFGKSAKRIGISAEEFQKMSFAARRSGASTSNVEKAMRKMGLTIFDAGKGLKTYQEYLTDLGLTYDDLKGKSPEKQFAIIAERLNAVADESTKAALAAKIFGKSGAEILPMIANYQTLGEELKTIGGIINDDTIKASEQLTDDMENLEVTLTAVAANSGFIKWLSDITGGLNDILKSGSMVKNFFGNLFKAVEDGKGIFKFSLPAMVKKFTGVSLSDKMGIGMGGEAEAITPEQEKAETEKLKKQKEMKKTGAEATVKAKERVDAEKEEARLMAEIYKEINKREAEEEKIAEQKIKQNELANDTIEQIKHEIAMQELKNKGLDKELAIKEALYSAEKAIGRELTAEEKTAIEQGTSELFDLNKKADKRSLGEQELGGIQSDSLLRIGGSTGDGNNGREALNLDKKRNDSLNKLVKLLDKEDKGLGGLETLI